MLFADPVPLHVSEHILNRTERHLFCIFRNTFTVSKRNLHADSKSINVKYLSRLAHVNLTDD